MDLITSTDGTSIAVYHYGVGPPLVLVHGTGSSSTRWQPVLPALSTHFTVITMDRRGYGKSGDHPEYAIEREFEDVAAVVDSLGEPVYLLGHSFGALCVLEAALLTNNIQKLILYEPGIQLPGIILYPEGVLDQMQSLLEAGDRDGVLTTLYRDVGMFPPHEMEQLKSSPDWPARLANAHIVLRESLAENDYKFDAQRFQSIDTPTILFSGSESPKFLKVATQTVDSVLPNSEVIVLPGQQHLAATMAPDLFAQAIIDSTQKST